MKRRPLLLVINNYSLERVTAEVRRGDKPAHHLYGVDRFPALGFDVEHVPFDELARPVRGAAARALRLLPPFGDLGQEIAALRRIDRGDLIYAPCQTQTQLLSYLRALHLLRRPLVTLAHHPISRYRWPWKLPALRLQLRGTDAFPSLSRGVARDIGEVSGRSDLSEVVPWGPDLDYYPAPDGTPGVGAIAAGRTGRDFLTFARAATAVGLPATILCLRSEAVVGHPTLGPNVVVTAVDRESDLNYRTSVPLLSRARVHAIPLTAGTSLSGLTSLTDALALGKPVIMTRHPLIDIDIEAERIGRWIDPGDTAGWATALRWFEQHPSEALAMGRRARALAEQKYNAALFAQRMVEIFARVLSRGVPGQPS
jgi:glycosyltransferase involved in cell wall biosynthesis